VNVCRLEDSRNENKHLAHELECFRSQTTIPRDKYCNWLCLKHAKVLFRVVIKSVAVVNWQSSDMR